MTIQRPALFVINPYLGYAQAVALLHSEPLPEPGIHPSASVADTAKIGLNVAVGANSSIADDAIIGDGVMIGAGCRIGHGVVIGESTQLKANVVVEYNCQIGQRCRIQAGAVIGSDGFGYARDGQRWVHIPQTGRVVIADDVEIGANTTIDRGAIDDTLIEQGVILDNQIQVAHNVVIGEYTAIAGCVGIAGSARIGKRCTIGGATTILGHLEIADDVHINGMSLVTSSIKKPGAYASSTPLDDVKVWRKNFIRLRQLDAFVKRVQGLEKSLKTLLGSGPKN